MTSFRANETPIPLTLVNNKDYTYSYSNNTNAGTGTFTAGPEVPQTIDGFLIKSIRDLGTWTVTATDGSNTATQDVLVDVITEYEIEMSLTA